MVLGISVCLGGCLGGDRDSAIVVRVALSHAPAAGVVTRLRVTVDDGRNSATREFSRPDATPLEFPTSFAIELGPDVAGPIAIEVRGLSAGGVVMVRGALHSLPVHGGKTRSVDIGLDCFGLCPRADAARPPDAADAGADTRDAARSDTASPCGNGKVDPGEICDTAIPRDRPGACPPSNCDDGIACTRDTRVGSGCDMQCTHVEIRAFSAGDKCCPANATRAEDQDCSASCGSGRIESGETCDRTIPPGTPGACPTAADCVDRDPCTTDLLISANTCSARCVHRPIVEFAAGDSCCPAGATNGTDSDCPVVCGNGLLEVGEVCDMGIAPGAPGACAAGCDDGEVCTADVATGSACTAACRHALITRMVGGDGCCPPGANRNLDADCGAVCGNGEVEPGEACDRAIAAGRPGACATTCLGGSIAGCMMQVLYGSAADCSSTCVIQPVAACVRGDACCPAGCSAESDGDCSATCGNRTLEPGETCDTAIAPGAPGACPIRCDDRVACTSDLLASGGTCSARCVHMPIEATLAGDGCCPPGANRNTDPDCPATCGNGVVEAPAEACDRAIAPGTIGACPAACPDAVACGKPTLRGDAAACTARCETDAITACVGGDGCCPAACSRVLDADCPAVCGNQVVEPGEACDRGLTAGIPGACPATCEDRACSTVTASGRVEDCTRACTYSAIAACAAGDACCPAGCGAANDGDCTSSCGNGIVEAGESCDPASTCPTTCSDDGDPCTGDKLGGSPALCNAACTHTPVTTCSGRTSDRCCPTGCNPAADIDCAGPP